MWFINKRIMDMQRMVDSCSKYIDTLAHGTCSSAKANALLDAAMQKIEECCISMRKICEEIRPPLPSSHTEKTIYHHQEIYGQVTVMDTGWVDIRLETLLPHCRALSGSKYITDTITRLLNKFKSEGGTLPLFEKAFVAIIEHCPMESSGVFDHDNKAFKTAINAVKGRLFQDDNQFELSLGLFTVQDIETCCHIVMPFEAAGDFLYLLASDML